RPGRRATRAPRCGPSRSAGRPGGRAAGGRRCGCAGRVRCPRRARPLPVPFPGPRTVKFPLPENVLRVILPTATQIAAIRRNLRLVAPVSPTSLARRAATGAAGTGALLTPSAPVTAAALAVEASLASRRSYQPSTSAPHLEGEFGDTGSGGAPLRLALLGDSAAAGVGVQSVAETVGGRLAARLASEGRRVRLSGAAIAGSRTGDLGPQVSRALLGRPDVAVLLIGTNDAMHAAAQPADRVAQVLRALLAVRARQLSAAQADAVRT